MNACSKCNGDLVMARLPRSDLGRPANPNNDGDWVPGGLRCINQDCELYGKRQTIELPEAVPQHLRPRTTPEQRRAAFDRLALSGPVTCLACGKQTEKHVDLVCAACFERVGTVPATSPVAPDPHCGFCGRAASQMQKDKETMLAGQTAMICSSCACACAGTIGAKSGAEARAMMASSALQAEAIGHCIAVMKLAGAAADSAFTHDGTNKKLGELDGASLAADTALALAQTAEALARIAKGQV